MKELKEMKVSTKSKAKNDKLLLLLVLYSLLYYLFLTTKKFFVFINV